MKEQFPILKNNPSLIYLDTAATSQKPQVVIDAVSHYYEHENANVHRAAHSLAQKATEVYEGAREKTAEFLHASAQEIVFTKSATESLNVLAHGLDIPENGVIVLSELEHHANIVAWQQVAKKTNSTIKWIPIQDYELDMRAAKQIISQGCDVLAVTHLSNVTGALTDIPTLCKLAHQVGARVVVDGSQAAGHLPINVQELDVDAYVFSAHKLYGPTGIGVLYAKSELLDSLSPLLTGGEMIDSVTKSGTTFAQPPGRFEAGTPPIAQAAGLSAAIKWFSAQDHSTTQIISYAHQELSRIPSLQLFSADHPVGCFSFALEGVHPSDLAQYLDTFNIAVRAGHHCTQPLHQVLGIEGSVRVSVGLYTDKKDIDALVQALESAREEL